MSTTAGPRLESGWLPSTPVDDNLLRQFVHSQAVVNDSTATALGGRTHRDDDAFLADTGGPVPYLNQAILARPLTTADDPALATIEAFYADAPAGGGTTLLSVWPTPDLTRRGWSLVGHPALVLRPPSPVTHDAGAGVEVRPARSAEDLAVAERIAIEGYPFDEARGRPAGSLLPPALAGTDLVVRLGLLGGTPVAIGNAVVAHGLVNLCLGATLPAARRRGVWEALVWARVGSVPDQPAVAYTSDDSRPGFRAMGFLPVTRFTLWARGR